MMIGLMICVQCFLAIFRCIQLTDQHFLSAFFKGMCFGRRCGLPCVLWAFSCRASLCADVVDGVHFF